jgi:hypothetical protein
MVYLVDDDGNRGHKIVASYAYHRAPRRFYVIHPAYGPIGDVAVGGVEIFGHDPVTEQYWAPFCDSQGNANTS